MSKATLLRFKAEVVRSVSLPYLEYRPDGPRPASGWPLVLFLHGAGEKGVDGAALRSSVLPRLIESGLRVPAILVCPQCPPGPGWPVGDLEAMLDTLVARDDVDSRVVHLTGVSMGGRGVWEFAYRRAADLASIVPVCAFGIPNLAPLLTGLPAWLFHGSADDVVPEARSAEMAAALESAGGEVRYTRIDGAGHECGEAVYRDPALWRWMLDQRRRESA